MYKGVANWDPIHEMASHPDIEIPIFGNGDVDSPEKALEMRQRYPNIKGAMIGRASIGNPWIFREIKHFFETGEHLERPSLAEKTRVCRRHLQMSVDWKPEIVAIREMRRHYSNYFKGIPNFKPTRLRLVTTEELSEIYDMLDEIEEMKLEDQMQVQAQTQVQVQIP
jgi:tRNA-dihydrouridine synthase B